MRANLFHNPNSGSGGHALDEIEAVLHLAGYEVKSYSVKDDDFPDRLKQSCDLIVVAGGDGTVGKVLSRMPDRTIPAAILPLGTANNIATSLGITGAPEEIAHRWSPERKKKLAIGQVSGPWGETAFVESVGFGAMVAATDKSIGKDKEGKSRLLLGRDAFRRAIKKGKARNIDVTVDGVALDGGIIALEIQNIGYAGPGLPLCLGANPGDTFLDVVAVREDQREKMMAWISATEEQTRPPVTVVRGRKIVIRWNGKPDMRIDDRSVEAPEEKITITVSVQRGPVTILVPPNTRAPRPKKAPSRSNIKVPARPVRKQANHAKPKSAAQRTAAKSKSTKR